MQVPRLPLQHVIGTCNGGQPPLHACVQACTRQDACTRTRTSACRCSLTVQKCTNVPHHTHLHACISHQTEVPWSTHVCTRVQYLTIQKCTHVQQSTPACMHVRCLNAQECMHVKQHACLRACRISYRTEVHACIKTCTRLHACAMPQHTKMHTCTRRHASACSCNVSPHGSALEHAYLHACATSHHTEVHVHAPEHICLHACAISYRTEVRASEHMHGYRRVQCLSIQKCTPAHSCNASPSGRACVHQSTRISTAAHLSMNHARGHARLHACTPQRPRMHHTKHAFARLHNTPPCRCARLHRATLARAPPHTAQHTLSFHRATARRAHTQGGASHPPPPLPCQL